MTARPRGLRESHLWLSGVVLLAVLVLVDLVVGRQLNGAYAGAAVLTAIYADARRTRAVAGLTVLMSTLSGVWHGNLGERERMWVYRRDQRPCRRCGTPVEVRMLGPQGRERAAYWCPSCQPAPA